MLCARSRSNDRLTPGLCAFLSNASVARPTIVKATSNGNTGCISCSAPKSISTLADYLIDLIGRKVTGRFR